MTTMVAGDTHFTAISTLLSLPQIQAGALRAIATAIDARDAAPGAADGGGAGFPRLRGDPVDGLLTSAGTPKEIIERINAEVNRACVSRT